MVDKNKLLKWLDDLYKGTGYREEKYAYGRVEQEILSGRFDINEDVESNKNKESRQQRKT